MKIFQHSFWKFGITIVLIAVCAGFITKRNIDPAEGRLKKSSLQTGVALYSFNRYSFVMALDKADSAGAKTIEGFFFHKMGKEFNDKTMGEISSDDVVRMKGMMDKKGMVMKSMYVGGAKNVAEWKSFFEMGRICKMKYLVCEPAKEDWDMIDSLAGIYKIKIAIHEHSKTKSIYWHPDSVLAAIKGHSNIGACADLGHWVRSGLNPVECLKMLDGHILGVHMKDIDESGNDKANDVLVGTGVIDYPAVVKELKRQHFAGVVNVECEHDWDNNLSDVAKAIKYFNQLAEAN